MLKNIFVLLTVILLVSLSVKSFSQTLTIYEFNARNPNQSDDAAWLIKINFYTDGLIKSYEGDYVETTWGLRGDGAR